MRYIYENFTDRQLENCTFAKTILMLNVILYHSIVFWNGNWFSVAQPAISACELGMLSQWLNSFHVYGFTLISGYLFYYLKVEQGKYSNYRLFVINKVKRLLIPYLFTAVLWVIPVSVYFFGYGLGDILKRYVLATSPNQLWFLWMLFDVFIIFFPLTDFFENHSLLGCFFAFAMYIIGLFGGKFLPNIYCIWTAFKYMIFFWIGFKLRQGVIKINSIHPFWWFMIDVFIFTVKREFDFGIIGEHVLGVIINIVGAIASFAILQELSEHIRWRRSNIFQMFSRCSMPMYLFHQQVIYFTITCFNGLVNPYVNAVINFVVSIGVSLIISNILLKYRQTRFMVGG